MPYRASPVFDAYERTLRRVFWSEFIDKYTNPNAPGIGAQQPPLPSASGEPQVAVYPFPKTYSHRQD